MNQEKFPIIVVQKDSCTMKKNDQLIMEYDKNIAITLNTAISHILQCTQYGTDS